MLWCPSSGRTGRILAAILGGSLSHDKVWAKSDIDLLLVTVDDTLAGPQHVSLYADGLNVHAMMMQRNAFRKLAESAVHQSFMHSFLAKSRVLFTHDDTIADSAPGCRGSATATHAWRCSGRPRTRCRASTRRTSSSSPEAISTTRRCGSSMRPRRSRRSR